MAKRTYPPAPKPERHPQPLRVLDGVGAWTTLTPELQAKLLSELSVGDWPQMVAYRCGCAPATIVAWLKKGCDPLAVEPYASFADAFLRKEADISAQLMTVIMDKALGRAERGDPDGPEPPDPGYCKWVLINRFQFLWRVDRETGKSGGLSVSEIVERHMLELSTDRADKARAILAQLPADAKAAARKEGFLLT